MLQACLMVLLGILNTVQDSGELTNEILLSELDSLSKAALWPGFNPADYPIAIYDGKNTILYRYPKQPEGFKSIQNESGTYIFDGHHPKVVANSSTVIDEIRVATVMKESLTAKSLQSSAALVIHELFHVYQREHHPEWSANEAHLFSYPFTDRKVYQLRLMESKAFFYAMQKTDISAAAKWILVALSYRTERYKLMDNSHAQYERDQEINEGLAQYVEDKSIGNSPLKRIPETLWVPEKVRNRAYTTGQILAHFLDIHLPEWKEMLNEGVSAPLDILLLVALKTQNLKAESISEKEKLEFEELAEHHIDTYKASLKEKKNDFKTMPGWRVKVEILKGANLLAPSGFDPLNVLNLGDGEIYHSRMLNLRSSQGSVRMLNLKAVSYGPNRHPLFHGVRHVEIAGIQNKPEIKQNGTDLEIHSEGLDLQFSNALFEIMEDNLVYVRIKPPGN